MAAITVNTNGQTLQVNASVSHWTTAALAVTASTSDDVESTTTTSITAPYTMHFSNSATTAVITVTQPDGSTLYSGTLDVSPGTGPRTLNPVPDDYQLAADAQARTYLDNQQPAGVVTTIPRAMTVASSVTCSTGSMRIGYFTMPTTMYVGRVRIHTGSTAAAATPTIIRVGVWTAPAATGALVAQVMATANDTTLLSVASTAYTKAVAANATLTAGTRYAAGVLVVTAAAAPTLLGQAPGQTSAMDLDPKMAAIAPSQADLPATFAAGSLSASTAAPYVEFLPPA